MVKAAAYPIEKFKKHEKDSGSTEVQVVRLTEEINLLQSHCDNNPKDFSSGRGLMQKVNQRRRFLTYLKRTNSDMYKSLVKELGLRK